LLLERHGILTRELVLAEGVPGGFAALYPELCRLETLGIARRGYFIEGLGGAQFALPGAVERVRGQQLSELERSRTLVLGASDPAQPYGAALPWVRPSGVRSPRSSPARVPGASVVLVGGEPALYLERGGRGLRVLLLDPEDARVPLALEALAEHAHAGRLAARIALERVDGEPVLGSRWEPALERAGFRVGPRRVELGAR
jgi:ATP-dependent Lhr-like helicase